MAIQLPRLPSYSNGVTRSNAPAAAPTSSGNDLTEADQANIRWLLNPSPDFNETDTNAAQSNLANGLSGGSAAAASKFRLRDSELRSRFEQGHAMLEPYTNRTQQATLQTQSEAARLNDIAAQGQQAMEQLKLQEQGLAERQSESEQARLRELAQSGQQALQQLQASQSGQQSLQSSALAAELQRLGISEAGANTRQQAQLGSAAAQQLAEINARLEIARLEGDQATQRQLQAQAAQLTAQTQAEAAALNETNVRGTQTSDLSRQNFGQNVTASIIDHYLTPSGGSGGGTHSASGGGGNISNGIGGRAFNPKYTGQSFNYITDAGGNVISGQKPPADYWDTSGGGSSGTTPWGGVRQALSGLSSVQSLLKQYGI